MKSQNLFVIRLFLFTLALSWPFTAKAEFDQLWLHDGYWVTKIKLDGFGPRIEVINDMHVNSETLRVTVYAQSRILGRTLSPPQVEPGECTQARNGEKHCAHPDAVYLNGSGRELETADGTGAWWVKHSWVLNGEGYCNTELAPKERYPPCTPVTGVLLEDGLTMKIGSEDGQGYNLRRPEISANGIEYSVKRFSRAQGEPTMPATLSFDLRWACKKRASDLDGDKRECPSAEQ